MKKVQFTPVPVPGTKPKSRSTEDAEMRRKAQQSQLSTEFVGSSDDDSNEEGPKLKRKKLESKSKTRSKPSHIFQGSEPKPNGLSDKVKTRMGNGMEAGRVNGNITSDSESSGTSNDSDDDDNSARSIDYPQRSEAESSSQSSSVSGSGSGSEEDTSEDEEHVGEEHRPGVRQIQPPTSQAHTVPIRPQQPYEPPPNFKLVSQTSNPSSRAAKLLKNLKGKDIMYITAPAGVPMAEVKKLSMESFTNGKAVLHHQGTEYGFASATITEEETKQVLIPTGNGYKATPLPISVTAHLQKLWDLPHLTERQADQNSGSATAAAISTSITTSSLKTPRTQPKGLRMRFLPSGFGANEPGVLGSSDSEEDTVVDPPSILPNGANSSTKHEKRRFEEMNGTEKSASPSKKLKKSKDPDEMKRRKEKKERREKKKSEQSENLKGL